MPLVAGGVVRMQVANGVARRRRSGRRRPGTVVHSASAGAVRCPHDVGRVAAPTDVDRGDRLRRQRVSAVSSGRERQTPSPRGARAGRRLLLRRRRDLLERLIASEASDRGPGEPSVGAVVTEAVCLAGADALATTTGVVLAGWLGPSRPRARTCLRAGTVAGARRDGRNAQPHRAADRRTARHRRPRRAAAADRPRRRAAPRRRPGADRRAGSEQPELRRRGLLLGRGGGLDLLDQLRLRRSPAPAARAGAAGRARACPAAGRSRRAGCRAGSACRARRRGGRSGTAARRAGR